MKPAVVIAAVFSALALVAAGCGGSDESSDTPEAVDWADELCVSITNWTDSLKQIGDQFTDLSSINENSLEEAANEAREATDTLTGDLRALGTPDTESGQEAKQAVDDLVTTLDGSVSEIEQTVEGVSGLSDLPGAISTLTSTLTAMSTAFSSTLQTIESADARGELTDAFEQAPACDELT